MLRRLASVVVLVLPVLAPAAEPLVSVGLGGEPNHALVLGNLLVVASGSWLAAIDLASGITIARQAQGSSVSALASSPAGDLLAVAACDHAIHLREAGSLALVRTLTVPQECPDSLSFSPDGRFLAVDAYGCDPAGNELQVWDVHTGALVRELAKGREIRRVVFGGNGQWLAGVDEQGAAQVLEWPSGRVLRVLEGLEHAGSSNAGFFSSPDGRFLGFLALGLRVWDLASGNEVALPGGGQVYVRDIPPDGPERSWTETCVSADFAAFLDDGRLAYVDNLILHLRDLLAGTESTVDLREVDERLARQVRMVNPQVWLHLSRDGRLLAGTRGSETLVLDLAARRAVELTAPTLGLPVSLYWRQPALMWGTVGGARVWDERTGKPAALGPFAEHATLLAASADGTRLALCGPRLPSILATIVYVVKSLLQRSYVPSLGEDSLSIIEPATGRVRASRSLEGPAYRRAAASSADGARLAVADKSSGLMLLDSRLRLERRIAAIGAEEYPEHLALSPDGRWVAVGLGGPHPAVRVWSLESAEATTLDTANVTYGDQPLAFSADSSLLASFRQGDTLVIWSAGTWAVARSWPLRGTGGSLAFAPFGFRLAVAADNELAVWDARSGSKVLELAAGSPGQFRQVAWSPDGRRLASSADDGVIRFWDASDGRLLASLYVTESDGDWLLVAPDGRLDGNEAALRLLVAWPTADGAARDPEWTEAQHAPGLWQAIFSTAVR